MTRPEPAEVHKYFELGSKIGDDSDGVSESAKTPVKAVAPVELTLSNTPAHYLRTTRDVPLQRSPVSALCSTLDQQPKLSHVKTAVAKQRGEVTPSPRHSQYSTPRTVQNGEKRYAAKLREETIISAKKKLKF